MAQPTASEVKHPPGPMELRLMENVYLGDVAAALPHESIVTVAGRCTITEGGPRRYDDVEHVIVISDEAYMTLKELGTLPRGRKGARARASGLRPLDLARKEAEWGERAARYERMLEAATSCELDAGEARQLALVCRAAERDLAWARGRMESEGGADGLAEAA